MPQRIPSYIAERFEVFTRYVSTDFLSRRAWALAAVHAVVFSILYFTAFAFRFELPLPATAARTFQNTLPWVLVLKMATFYLMGHSRIWWRHVSFADVIGLVRTVGFSFLLLAALGQFHLIPDIPRIVLLLDALLTLTVLGGLRALWRAFRENLGPFIARSKPRPVLLVGTDPNTGRLAQQIHAHPELPLRVRGFLSFHGDTCRPDGYRMGDIPVLGSLDHLASLAARFRVAEVLVVAGTLPGHRLRQLMTDCRNAHLELRIVASLDEHLRGSFDIPVRPIDINDLLGREPVQLDCHALRDLLLGKRVLVTGAGGSIGGEICRQLLRFRPDELVLLGRGENRIFEIHNELAQRPGGTRLCPVIADVTDAQRMRQVFEAFRPQIVFHAAAHKHVPLMEANVCQAIKNNVFGTRLVADLAEEFHVQQFVLISTDKAVNPSSVMGMTKQLAERYIHSRSSQSDTRFVCVRFGNVLGSAGSVVPIFQRQIRVGGPITITDLRMTRYFMTIPEASQLVLQAVAMGRGGEIFVLDMGPPIRIVDLARDMIRLSGLPPEAIEIKEVGLRPGEKLYEELEAEGELLESTQHSGLRRAIANGADPATVDELLHHVLALTQRSPPLDAATLRQEFEALLGPPDPVRNAQESRVSRSGLPT